MDSTMADPSFETQAFGLLLGMRSEIAIPHGEERREATRLEPMRGCGTSQQHLEPAMAAYGLYTHIQSNKRRSIALLVGLFFLVYLLVYAGALLGEAFTIDAPPDVLLRRALQDALYAVPWATLGTALWILIAYKFHQRMIDAVTGGREVTRQQEPRLYNLLENLCISRGITTPTLKAIEDDNPNAFATGSHDKQYSITVTSGLINSLNDAEIESVLGHELTHIRNGDVRLLVIAVIIAGVIAFFAELVFRLMFQGGLRWRGRAAAIAGAARGW